jgi:hypothetical protein
MTLPFHFLIKDILHRKHLIFQLIFSLALACRTGHSDMPPSITNKSFFSEVALL